MTNTGEVETCTEKPAKIFFNFQVKRFENIHIDQVHLWEKCFDRVDVVKHLTLDMPVWILANKDGKGRKKKWEQFIVNWLSREQNRGKGPLPWKPVKLPKEEPGVSTNKPGNRRDLCDQKEKSGQKNLFETSATNS